MAFKPKSKQNQLVLNKINSLDLSGHGYRIFLSMKKTIPFQLHEALYLGESSGLFTYSLKEDPNDTRGMLFAAGPQIYATEALLSYLMLYISALDKESCIYNYLPDSKSDSIEDSLKTFALSHGMFIQSTNFSFKKPLRIKEKIQLYWKIDPFDAKSVKFSTEHHHNGKICTEGGHLLAFISPDVVNKKKLLKPKL